MTELLERLRQADENSQQRTAGSRIFKEAADEIERLYELAQFKATYAALDEARSLRAENERLRRLVIDLIDAVEWIDGTHDRRYGYEPEIAERARAALEQLPILGEPK